jgi:Cysteine-rich secretory protein family
MGLMGTALAWNPLPEVPVTNGLETAERAILNGTNLERTRAGLKPLILDARLTAAARLHALDMSTRGELSHTSPKPGFTTPSDRVARAGSLDWGAGENIAFNEEAQNRVGEYLTQQWLNSPPHRKNILEGKYTHVGIGVYRDARGRSYGVQNFVTRAFEVTPSATVQDLNLQTLTLSTRVTGNVEVALFSGSEYLGALEVNRDGQIATTVPFAPNQELGLGSRPRGSTGSYLISMTLRSPAAFQSGALTPRALGQTVFRDVRASLSARVQRSHVLELRFSGNRQPVLVFETIGNQDRRVVVQNAVARVICPVSAEKRTVKLAMGGQTYMFTHRFVFDCQTGRILPAAP